MQWGYSSSLSFSFYMISLFTNYYIFLVTLMSITLVSNRGSTKGSKFKPHPRFFIYLYFMMSWNRNRWVNVHFFTLCVEGNKTLSRQGDLLGRLIFCIGVFTTWCINNKFEILWMARHVVTSPWLVFSFLALMAQTWLRESMHIVGYLTSFIVMIKI